MEACTVACLHTAAQSAFVIGSGPNGLTAAILLARAGLRVTVLEAESSIGGGARSAALTLPGFVHDICSAVHPLAVSSPVFASFPLAQHGLQWIHPALPLAHALDDGSAAVLHRSLGATCAAMGADGPRYRRAIAPLVEHWAELTQEILGPLHFPHKPLLLARLGLLSSASSATVARVLFRSAAVRALFGGIAAHSVLPLNALGSAAFAWVLAAAAHAAGWPVPRGGSQQITNALASYFKSLGGRIETNTRVRSLDELGRDQLILCDVTPAQMLALTGDRLPGVFRAKLAAYRYGPGVFKVDWALRAPVPWRAEACARAGTVHLGGTFDEIAAAEKAVAEGRIPEQPFVLLAQPSLFDNTRAPRGSHTAWAYCHVPNGSPFDMTERIEAQVERFAPGFRSHILARHTLTPAQMQEHNANLRGGDISGGANDLAQLFLRPTRMLYRTPLEGVYFCSSSTPPGGGVHGMCGYHAARAALRDAGLERGR